jgi:hypothetical protein
VVVPIDFSDDSFAALDTAAELAADKADLRVIHVLPELEPAEPGVIWNMRRKHSKPNCSNEGGEGSRSVSALEIPGMRLPDLRKNSTPD